MNVYLEKIKQVLPRILSFTNRNIVNQSYGIGDRLRWAWGTTDFSNSTFQCQVFGLSCLVRSKFFSKKEKLVFLTHIKILFRGLKNILKLNQGLSEAFPKEYSYCVYALVAETYLGALNNINKYLTKDEYKDWVDTIEPIVWFLINEKETHGKITNHQSSAALAILRWSKIKKDKNTRDFFKKKINLIKKNQSTEGWFYEYDGFDPGYETLNLNNLIQINSIIKDKNINKRINKSVKFLSNFIHPDLSFGGQYGSRNTNFIFPGGIEIFSKLSQNAKIFSDLIKQSIKEGKHSTILSMDDNNLVPMFNSYCLALINLNKSKKLKRKISNKNEIFYKSGLIIKSNKNFYLIINFKKGGLFYYFKGKKIIKNYGVLIKYKKNFYSTQKFDEKNILYKNKNKIIVTSSFKKINYRNINLYEFLILRLLSLTIFNFSFFREKFKQKIVNLVINRNIYINIQNQRILEINDNKISYRDNLSNKDRCELITNKNYFSHIHMASQGYWHK